MELTQLLDRIKPEHSERKEFEDLLRAKYEIAKESGTTPIATNMIAHPQAHGEPESCKDDWLVKQYVDKIFPLSTEYFNTFVRNLIDHEVNATGKK